VDSQGPVDSLVSGSDGRFARPIRADSGVIYLVSARWAGIEYFGVPLRFDSVGTPSAVDVVVSDTSATALVGVSARHMIVAAPGPDGMRGVVDLVVLQNDGPDTRVPRDPSRATWWMRVPPEAVNLQVAQSDFANDALIAVGDTVLVRAPIPPGVRQLTLEYQVPPGVRRVSLPVDDAVPAFNLLAEEAGLRVDGPLVRGDTQAVDQRTFTRWGGAVPPGSVLTLTFPGAAPLPNWVLPALVGLLGLALALLGRRAWRRAAAPDIATTISPAERRDALVARMAELDLAHRAGAGRSDTREWTAYQAERAALKAELERLLLRGK
jgi:hypothetical protein